MLPEISKHNKEAVPQNPKPHTLLFKPRQVLLSLRRNTTTATATETTMKNSEEQATLNSDQKSLLLNSVLCYLNNHGFDKPLKRLISAANIQDEKWKACSLDLEDMFKHYLETCSNSNANAKMDTSKDEEMLSNGTKKDGDDHSSKEAIVKKKKKKGGDTENIPAVAEDIEVKTKKKTKKASDSIEESEQVSEQVKKEQKDKKKKSKHNSVPLESNIDSLEEVKPKDKKKKSEKSAKSDGDGEAVPDVEGKSKDKKKKKKQNLDSSIEKAEKPLEGETVLSKDEKKEKEESASEILSNGVTEMENKEGIKEQEKESKKRKRSDSDEKDNGTPLKNGDYQVNGGESTGNKSRKKDNNGSAEPKTVTAFQRVKIDDVKFADKRLQDNSYWAKDGADVGYGAKAQEVLGQVRGRDFRHEKTKKKRGSYRGGQIDLHSHSVKFNYDNED